LKQRLHVLIANWEIPQEIEPILSPDVWGAKVDKNPNTILTQNKIKSRLVVAKK